MDIATSSSSRLDVVTRHIPPQPPNPPEAEETPPQTIHCTLEGISSDEDSRMATTYRAALEEFGRTTTYPDALKQFRLAEEIRIATAASLIEAGRPPSSQPPSPAPEHEPEAADLLPCAQHTG